MKCTWGALGFALLMGPAHSESLSLSTFLQQSSKKDLVVERAQLELETAEQNFHQARGRFETLLTATPNLQWKMQELLTQEERGRYFGVSSKIEQNAGWGFGLEFSAHRLMPWGPESKKDLPVSSYNFGFRKSLIQNLLGRTENRVIAQAQAVLDAARLNFESKTLEQCRENAQIFIEAWLAQENSRVLAEIGRDAQSVEKQLQRNLRQRLVREIDYLGSQADASQKISYAFAAEQKLRQQIIKLQSQVQQALPEGVYLEEPRMLSLSSVSSFDDELKTAKLLMAESPMIQARRKLVEAAQLDTEIASLKHFPDLSFTLGRAWQSEKFASESSFVPRQVQETHVGLELRWKLFDRSRSADKIRARIETQAQSSFFVSEMRSLLSEVEQTLVVKETIIQRLSEFSKRSELYERQLVLAQRDLKSGRLEFETYIAYRDRFLNDKLQSLELRQDAYLTSLFFYSLNKELLNFCGAQNL